MNNVNNDHSIKIPQPKADIRPNKNSETNKNQLNKAQDIRELDYLHKLTDKDLKKTVENTKQGFFAKIWNSIKSLFGFGKRQKKLVEGSKLYIDEPAAKNSYTPKVLIYDGLIDMNFIEKNLNKYLFMLSGNLKGVGGRYGQSSILRPAKNKYPDSIIELPVTLEHANVLDPATLKEVSFKEDTEEELAQNLKHINNAIEDAIEKSSITGKTILMLKGGYGTGGARMFAFAPRTFKGMNKLFEKKLGVRNMLDPLRAKYSLDYVSELAKDLETDTKINLDNEPGFSPEEVSRDLWANGWSLSKHNT